jgi:biopolymer transport protein ExbD
VDRIPTGAGNDLAPPPTSSGVTGINVTPLIDVLLVLFIVFLVIVLLSRQSLHIAVPVADGPGGITPQILLDITPSGAYQLNGQPIPGNMLAPVLGGALRDRAVKLVFIRTAPQRSYQDFITAADIARGAGASMVALVSP